MFSKRKIVGLVCAGICLSKAGTALAQVDSFSEDTRGHYLLAYTNQDPANKTSNQLPREFVVDQFLGRPLRLVYIKFQYLVDGEIQTVTMNDIKFIKPNSEGLQLFFSVTNVPAQVLDFSPFSQHHLESIHIELGTKATVTTNFVIDGRPRMTLLERHDDRQPYEAIHEMPEKVVEVFNQDRKRVSELSQDRILQLNEKTRQLGRGWIDEAIKEKLLYPLTTLKSGEFPGAVSSEYDISTSIRGYVFNFDVYHAKTRVTLRYLASGNARDLSQLISLAFAHSPSEAMKLLDMRADTVNLKLSPGEVVIFYSSPRIIRPEYRPRASISVRKILEVGEMHPNQFWKFSASQISDNSRFFSSIIKSCRAAIVNHLGW